MNFEPSQDGNRSGSADWYTGEASYAGFSGTPLNQDSQGDYGAAYPQQNTYSNQFTSHGFDNPKPEEIGGIVGGGLDDDDYVEPPLLEELGINFQHIWTKTVAVMIPTKKLDPEILADSDLAGPIVFFAIQGFCLLLVSFE